MGQQESLLENNETLMKLNDELTFDETFSEFSLLLREEKLTTSKETQFAKNRNFYGFRNF